MFSKTKMKAFISYLIPYTELFKTDGALTTISWDRLEPKLRKLLNKCLHSFPLQEKQVCYQMQGKAIKAYI